MNDQIAKLYASVRDVFFLEKTPITTDSLNQIAKLTIITATASLFDILVFIAGALGRLDATLLTVWAAAALLLPVSSLLGRKPSQAPRAIKTISRRGFRKTIANAALFAAPWAALPLLFLGQDPITDILIVAVTAGMAAAGAFMLCPIPAAAIVYFTLIEAAVVVGCVIAGLGDYGALAAFTAPFVVVLAIVTLRSFKLSRERSEGLRRATAALDSLERANRELEKMRGDAERDAVIDELTGLQNRRGLSREIARRRASPRAGAAVLHLDLDRFKQINDTLGHAAGDQILRHAAEILRDNTRANDFIARIGGDEFVIIADFNGDQHAIMDLASRLIRAMRRPIRVEGEICNFGASIGVDLTSDAPDLGAMVLNADIALYRAKAGGRNRFHLFSPMLAEQVRREKSLGDDLLSSIAERRLEVVYQPQFNGDDGRLAAVEAFVRWNHPSRGALAPSEFLPLARRLGVAAELDQIVLETALGQLRAWETQGFRLPLLSVNVSAERLCDPTLPEKLALLDLPKDRLSFKIGEDAFLAALEEGLVPQIDQLAESGVALELGGFGAGNSSLTALMTHRPSRVKIARDLVMDVAQTPQLGTLIRALTEIARSLDIGVTAEGIETQESAAAARSAGCDRLQGYWFAKPMNAAAIFERYGRAPATPQRATRADAFTG